MEKFYRLLNLNILIFSVLLRSKMPFGGNWSEELVAEWLSLKGYLVEVHVPAGSAEAGGRYAADVVGVKVKGGKMEICHAEVGTLPRDFEKSVETIKR
jgi:hypothetical protein